MDSFHNLTRMDRRKFLAGFLATAATAGVLGKLGIDEGLEWTGTMKAAILHPDWDKNLREGRLGWTYYGFDESGFLREWDGEKFEDDDAGRNHDRR